MLLLILTLAAYPLVALAEDSSSAFLHFPLKGSKAPQINDIAKRQNNVALESDLGGLFYTIDISIGTPGNPISVQFDTGSEELWVNPSCERSPDPGFCASTGRFITSATFTDLNTAGGLQYNDGFVNWNYGYDTVTIGSTRLGLQIFGVGYDSSGLSAGVMGLAPSIYGWDNPYPYVLDTMFYEGHINSRAYSLDLRSVESQSGSVIFGGIDIGKYAGTLEKLPVVPASASPDGYNRWWVNLNGIAVTTESGEDIPVFSGTQTVWLNSRYTLSGLPGDIFLSLLQAFPSAAPVDGSTRYTVDCAVADLPGVIDITFGATTIHIPYADMVWQVADGTCYLGFYRSDALPVLGISFLRAAYVVFDFDNRNVLIANNEDCETNIVAIGTGPNAVPSIAGECALSTPTPSPTSTFSSTSSLPSTSILTSETITDSTVSSTSLSESSPSTETSTSSSVPSSLTETSTSSSVPLTSAPSSTLTSTEASDASTLSFADSTTVSPSISSSTTTSSFSEDVLSLLPVFEDGTTISSSAASSVSIDLSLLPDFQDSTTTTLSSSLSATVSFSEELSLLPGVEGSATTSSPALLSPTITSFLQESSLVPGPEDATINSSLPLSTPSSSSLSPHSSFSSPSAPLPPSSTSSAPSPPSLATSLSSDDECNNGACAFTHDFTGIAISQSSSETSTAYVPVTRTPTTQTGVVIITTTYTITSCASNVAECSLGHMTTEVITQYTTFCPELTNIYTLPNCFCDEHGCVAGSSNVVTIPPLTTALEPVMIPTVSVNLPTKPAEAPSIPTSAAELDVSGDESSVAADHPAWYNNNSTNSFISSSTLVLASPSVPSPPAVTAHATSRPLSRALFALIGAVAFWLL